MKTSIKKDGDTVVISLTGKINFASREDLKQDLAHLFYPAENTDTVPKKIIFNMEKLEFVGSSGITSLIQTLKEFDTATLEHPRYCNARSEFKKIFKAYDEDNIFNFYDNEERALSSFIPAVPGDPNAGGNA